MKRRTRIKRIDGVRQRYWVGKKLRKNYGMAATYKIPHWLLKQLNEQDKKEAERLLFEKQENIGAIAKKFGIKHPSEVPRRPPIIVPKAQKIQILQELGQKLGKAPTADDIRKEQGIPSETSFRHEFGSWNKALEAAGFSPNVPTFSVDPINQVIESIGHTPSEKERLLFHKKEYYQIPKIKEMKKETRKRHHLRQKGLVVFRDTFKEDET